MNTESENNIESGYPEGSEWRKWDLHVHSPASSGYSGDYDGLVSQISESDCTVIGINDYCTVEGFKELCERFCGNKTLLPVVEFRMSNTLTNRRNPQAGERINFHVIFDPRVGISIIDNFIKSIEFKDSNGNDSLIANVQNKDDLLKVGVNYFDVVKRLEANSDLRGNYLVWLPYDEYGGINEIDPESSYFKPAIINKADLIGSSRKKQIEFFLWQDNRFSKKKFKSWFGYPKCCIKGSDSKSCEYPIGKLMDERSEPTDKYCWIKADPTFYGLQQLVHEPEERVRIQAEKPEEKRSYLVIDKVRFIGNGGNHIFPSDYIPLNHSLTTIIGGKSTGKSLLLYCMAKTIDSQEIDARTMDDELGSGGYDFGNCPNFDFEVVWGDSESTLLTNGSEQREQKRKVLYMPQGYLNRLSEKNVKGKAAINKFVLDILLQDADLKNKYEKHLEYVKEISGAIQSGIGGLFSIKQEIDQLREDMKNVGEQKGLERYIKQLREEIESTLKTSPGASQEDRKKYGELVNKKKTLNTQISNLEEDKGIINNCRQRMLSLASDIKSTMVDYHDRLHSHDTKKRFLEEFQAVESFGTVIEASQNTLTKEIDAKIEELSIELKQLDAELGPLLAKYSAQAQLNKKEEAVTQEQQKLNTILRLQKNLDTKNNDFSLRCTGITDLYQELYTAYGGIRDALKGYEDRFADISLNVAVGFKEREFNSDVVDEYLDKRDLKRTFASAVWVEEFDYKYSSETHIDNINTIYSGLLEGNIKTIKNRQVEDALFKLLGNLFFIDFSISYRGDSLEDMSPGKKALVLLRLLIDLSNEEWPILLDQPDDDLDSRSVYNDLVSFIKEKKKKRQIIIVTHNPNLVVGADAEEVIVANQDGQEPGLDNRKYRFEYVSGALENSFEIPESAEGAVLYRMGIRQHVCDILEGGEEAFQKRERRYDFPD